MQELTFVLLKPDCLERELVAPVLAVLRAHVEIVHQESVVVAENHVHSMWSAVVVRLGEVAREHLRRYVGREVIVLLVRGEDAVSRVRTLVGSADPSNAEPDSIRGMFCYDSFDRAREEGRLVYNTIHASDSTDAVIRECRIWFGNDKWVSAKDLELMEQQM